MVETDHLVFVASGRAVTALDRGTGRPVWVCKLPRSGFFPHPLGEFLTLAASGRELFVGRGGYLYCIDQNSGEVLWERGLKAGGGMVFIATGADGQGTNMQAQQSGAAAAAAASG